jgi:hypothetical protein
VAESLPADLTAKAVVATFEKAVEVAVPILVPA